MLRFQNIHNPERPLVGYTQIFRPFRCGPTPAEHHVMNDQRPMLGWRAVASPPPWHLSPSFEEIQTEISRILGARNQQRVVAFDVCC